MTNSQRLSKEVYPSKHYARLINSIYYHEFDEDFADEVLELTKCINIEELFEENTYNLFDLLMVPYKIELQLNYYRNGEVPNGAYEGKDILDIANKISLVGAKIASILEEKIRSYSVERSI